MQNPDYDHANQRGESPVSSPSHRRKQPSSSYVSTLSHALNITTPTSLRKKTLASPTASQAAPASQRQPTPASHSITPAKDHALQTPTRHPAPPQLLSLSGHEAFSSPGTPASPWPTVPVRESVLGQDDSMPHPNSRQQYRTLARDQEWLMSGSSSQRTFDMFAIGSQPRPMPVSHASHAIGSVPITASARWTQADGLSLLPVSTEGVAVPPTTSGAFRSYREQPSGNQRAQASESALLPDPIASTSVLSPTSNASLSPTPAMSAVPIGFNDAPFLGSIFQQETPSLSTHLLPSNDLTDQLDPQTMHLTASNPPPPLDPAGLHARPLGQRMTVNDSSAASNTERASSGLLPRQPSAATASAVYLHSPSTLATSNYSASTGGRETAQVAGAESQVNMHDDRAFFLPVNSGGGQGGGGNVVEEEALSGLGLNLDVSSPPAHSKASRIPSAPSGLMLVDEMGRWFLGPNAEDPLAYNDSGALHHRAGRWHQNETSSASLGATTEASFTSHSNSSTWDTSFNDLHSSISGAHSATASSHSTTTPASSIGLSQSQSRAAGKPAEMAPEAMGALRPDATPEVAMHDFSEFGQSVSIEQMAEERWRTWPRSRDSVVLQNRASTSALPATQEPIVAATPNRPDERTSFESLSVSSSSTRSRLMAEPYNKNMRSGRPSSSASTSSRSSVGNLAANEAQVSSGTTGPTRPRSHIASGSLRMSTAGRTGSSGGLNVDGGFNPPERVSGTALALRRARGMSQASMPASGTGASSMKLTRSSDAILPPNGAASSAAKARHSIALQRNAKSSEGASLITQRPQSVLGTSTDSESLRRLATAPDQAREKVGFNEVSAALDLLRTFFTQKPQNDSVKPNEPGAEEEIRSAAKDADDGWSPSKPGRTLRRTKGILPPRGVFSSVDEFGTLQTPVAARMYGDSGDSTSILRPGHGRTQSLGVGHKALDTRPGPSFGRQDDRMAVLEDLSERVLRLQAESERQRERQAAATMPPPPARPASMMAQQQQSPGLSRTRREMHEEYLRKRSGGS